MRKSVLLLSGLCLALGACASSQLPEGGPVGAPRAPAGYIATAEYGSVLVEAKFNSAYESEFGELIEDERLIPIKVKFVNAKRTGDLQRVDVDPDKMEFRLVLQDGSELSAVRMGDGPIVRGDDELAQRLERRALATGLLVDSLEGYLYFKLSPKDAYEYSDGELIHTTGALERNLKLSQSLLTFRLVVGGKPNQLFLGLSR
ncbi:MAG: hypothetical protein NTV21_19220 [Planctomycetota bacterium]|nr:hypothetical protein [Planctomycetota bacterium]